MSKFREVLEEASERVELNELRRNLNRKQVRAAIIYLKNLLTADAGVEIENHDKEMRCEHGVWKADHCYQCYVESNEKT